MLSLSADKLARSRSRSGTSAVQPAGHPLAARGVRARSDSRLETFDDDDVVRAVDHANEAQFARGGSSSTSSRSRRPSCISETANVPWATPPALDRVNPISSSSYETIEDELTRYTSWRSPAAPLKSPHHSGGSGESPGRPRWGHQAEASPLFSPTATVSPTVSPSPDSAPSSTQPTRPPTPRAFTPERARLAPTPQLAPTTSLANAPTIPHRLPTRQPAPTMLSHISCASHPAGDTPVISPSQVVRTQMDWLHKMMGNLRSTEDEDDMRFSDASDPEAPKRSSPLSRSSPLTPKRHLPALSAKDETRLRAAAAAEYRRPLRLVVSPIPTGAAPLALPATRSGCVRLGTSTEGSSEPATPMTPSSALQKAFASQPAVRRALCLLRRCDNQLEVQRACPQPHVRSHMSAAICPQPQPSPPHHTTPPLQAHLGGPPTHSPPHHTNIRCQPTLVCSRACDSCAQVLECSRLHPGRLPLPYSSLRLLWQAAGAGGNLFLPNSLRALRDAWETERQRRLGVLLAKRDATAITKLQRVWRDCPAFALACSHQVEVRAARRLQAVFRGHVARTVHGDELATAVSLTVPYRRHR